MKYWIYGEEWYPVYELYEEEFKGEPCIEISKELKERYDKAFKEFNEVQKILSDYANAHYRRKK